MTGGSSGMGFFHIVLVVNLQEREIVWLVGPPVLYLYRA